MSVPNWVRPVDRKRWEKPWTVSANRHRNRKFKKMLWNHGYLSPNFRRSEARCSDGTDVPKRLKGHAQKHAFRLERARRELGRPLSPLSWYRTPAYNSQVGGASSSRHLKADATDWGRQPKQPVFNQVMSRVFKHGGIGTGCVSHNVQHVDTRGVTARWCYSGR